MCKKKVLTLAEAPVLEGIFIILTGPEDTEDSIGSSQCCCVEMQVRCDST